MKELTPEEVELTQKRGDRDCSRIQASCQEVLLLDVSHGSVPSGSSCDDSQRTGNARPSPAFLQVPGAQSQKRDMTLPSCRLCPCGPLRSTLARVESPVDLR